MYPVQWEERVLLSPISKSCPSKLFHGQNSEGWVYPWLPFVKGLTVWFSQCDDLFNQTRMPLQFQGYLIGNGATDSATDNINIFQLYSNWPLIPPSLSAELTANECGTLSNPIGISFFSCPSSWRYTVCNISCLCAILMSACMHNSFCVTTLPKLTSESSCDVADADSIEFTGANQTQGDLAYLLQSGKIACIAWTII